MNKEEEVIVIKREGDEVTAHVVCPECSAISDFSIPRDAFVCPRCGEEIIKDEGIGV